MTKADDNGEGPLTVNGHLEDAAGISDAETAARSDGPVGNGAAPRGTHIGPIGNGAAPRDTPIDHVGNGAAPRDAPIRLPEALDHRLRGIRTESTHDVPATPAPTERRQRPSPRRVGLLTKLAAFVAVAALAVLLLQAFVIQPFAVPGDAMAPTLQAGDKVLVLKWGLFEGPIRRGEILAVHPPRSLSCTVTGGRAGDLALRVVAVPGELIRSVGDTVFVDGRPLHERGWYDPRTGQVGSTPIRSTILAPGQYFLLGDNRSNACDSRVFGPVSKSSVVGEVVAIIGRRGHVFFATL